MLLFWYACGWLIVAFLCSAVAAAVVPQPSPCRTRRVRWWTSTSPGSGTFAFSCSNSVTTLSLLVMWNTKRLTCSCSSATNRIITAKDHASVQINIGHLDANGMYDGHFTTFALSGFVRAQVIVNILAVKFILIAVCLVYWILSYKVMPGCNFLLWMSIIFCDSDCWSPESFSIGPFFL